MPPGGFEPTISAGERPQTYAFDRAATETGNLKHKLSKLVQTLFKAVFLNFRETADQ